MTYLDCVVLLDFWVGVADRPAIVGYNVWNLVFAHALSLDFAELESCFFGVDAHWLETTLDVVQDAEVLAGFWDLDNIHKAKWEAWVSSNFVVNFDISVSVAADFDRVLAGERVFESVLQKHGKGNALSEFVGSSRWTGCINSLQFFQTPVGWCVHSLHMLSWSSSLTNQYSVTPFRLFHDHNAVFTQKEGSECYLPFLKRRVRYNNK